MAKRNPTKPQRPRPPESLFADCDRPVAPDLECAVWIIQTFIAEDGALTNPDHQHLQSARIGVLWTSLARFQHMRSVVGQAEVPVFQGNSWAKARQSQQMVEWFGFEPDFVLTFDAHFAAGCTDVEWCRVVEHELYHCGQRSDEFGTPKFHRDGTPDFGIRGHDVEEFVGVVARYGATQSVQSLIDAAQSAKVKQAAINGVCGTCRLIV